MSLISKAFAPDGIFGRHNSHKRRTRARHRVSFVQFVAPRISLKLTWHGITRVSHPPRFQYFLQSVEIRRHFFSGKFPDQSECSASKAPEGRTHDCANVSVTRA